MRFTRQQMEEYYKTKSDYLVTMYEQQKAKLPRQRVLFFWIGWLTGAAFLVGLKLLDFIAK